MALSNTDLVTELYIGYFNRAPDPAGLQYWVNGLKNGVTFAQIADQFAKSSESTAIYPYLTLPTIVTPDSFINQVYTNVLGRPAEAGGLAFWKNALQTGAVTPGNFIATIIQTVNQQVGSADALTLQHKTAVAEYYTSQYATNNVPFSQTSAKAALAGVDTTDASVVAAKASIDQAVANGTPGQTYTLTTGIDPIVGTTGADIINAPTVAGADTFTALDSIDGGGGIDTLNIVSAGGALTSAAGATVKNVEVINLTSAAAITAADISGWTGATTFNVQSAGAISGVVAAATTDINVGSGLAAVTVNGGKNVVVNSSGGNISIGATTAAAGNVTATNTFAGGTIGEAGAGVLTATSKSGAITFTGGTSVNATASQAVSAATRAADLAAQASATAANTAAVNNTDASGLAKVAAANKVTALTTLATAITNATNVSADATTANSIQAATTTAFLAGAITSDQKVQIDAAFAAGLPTSTAAARTAAQNVLTPLQTAATTASTAAAAADAINDANALAAKTAADAVVTADTTKGTAVAAVNVTATTNTALASATVTGNYGATNTITDGSALNNTLTTVTLNNAGSSTITGKAVTNVSATGQASDVTVVNSTAAHTQNFTLSGITGGTYTDANATTVNVVSNGTATNVLTGLSATLATAVTLSGTAGLNFGTTTFAANAVVDASATSGANTIAIAAGQKYIGGSGVDTVTAGAALQTATVDGGAGSADVLVLTNAAAYATTGAAKFLNFEVLNVGAGLTVDASQFTGSTFTSAVINGAATLTGLSATQAAHVTETASGAFTLGVTGATNVGQIDTVELTVNDGLAGVNTLSLTPTLAGVEILKVHAPTDNVTITSLTGATALTNVTFDGAGAVNVTTGALALNVNTVIDAHAVTGTVTIDASASTANGLKIVGSDTANSTLTGNALASVLTAGNGNNTVTGGAAADTITLGNGNNTVHGGGGADVITVGNGNNTIDGFSGGTVVAGNGWNVITGGAGADTITVGTGGNLITGGAGADTIKFGAHVAGVIDGITINSAAAATGGDSGSFTAPGTNTISTTTFDVVTGLHAGDTIATLGTYTAVAGAAANATLVSNAVASNTLVGVGADNTVTFVRGTYDATAHTFVGSATGADTLLVVDTASNTATQAYEATVLVGFVETNLVGVATVANSHALITLA